MKNLKWFLAIALCAIALVWFFKREKPQSVPLAQAPDASSIPGNDNAPEQTRQADQTTSPPVMPVRPVPEPESLVTPEEKARMIIESRNAPVEFWGQVVDQNDAPLPGVEIQSRIRHWDFVPGVGASQRNIDGVVTTGADGQFHVGGSSGDDLTIRMEKDGYELEPKAKLGFGFGTAEPFTSQPEAPVIFKMWPTNIHEQLIAGQKSFHIVPDGRLYMIDLAKGTIAEQGAGDLKLWIKRPEQVAPGQKYDWSSEIDAINGDLLEETNVTSSMYLAPQAGYAPNFKYEQQIIGRQSASTGTRRFYVKLDNGREYGRITIELIAPYNDRVPGMVHLDYAINPSGSPILR
ncbi:MAG TPA: carboxypeptidase-like regulatory domain-containing protein [Terriglobales bacterium]